jgi:cell wall assembly regulator SMI1
MPKTPKWDNECRYAVVNGDASAMRRAVSLGLPVNQYVYGSKTFTPLHYAVNRAAKSAVIAVLLEAEADVNAWVAASSTSLASTPLMMAAYEGRLDLVTQLLATGADIHAKDQYGITALACAGWGGKTSAHERVMRELIANGARPDAEALTAAARHGSPEMVWMLVDSGANVNEISRWGTALHLAVDEKRTDTVEALLAAGADPTFQLPRDARNYGGKTALDLARQKKLKKIILLLEAAAGHRPVPPASRPETTPTSIADVWKQLEITLKAVAPNVKKSLNRPTTDAKLDELESRLGLQLPAEVRLSYLRHNGQKSEHAGLLPEGFADLDDEYRLLTVADILAEWKPWKELLDIGEFVGETATPDVGVRVDWWNPGWVPIASNGGGDSVCIDLAPAVGSTLGQVILMSHESSDRLRLARSLGEMLTELVHYYEQQADAE